MGLPLTSTLPNTQTQTDNISSGASLASELPPTTTPLKKQTESDADQLASNQTAEWETYEDTDYDFRIEYPPEWEIEDSTSSDNMMDIISISGKKQIVTITPDDDSSTLGKRTSVTVSVENVSRSLDPTTLQVISLSVEDYANEFTKALVSPISQSLSSDTLSSIPNILKDQAVTFNGQPAWRVDYITNAAGYQIGYDSKIFVIKDGKAFDINFSTAPLLVPEMRPIGDKILQSFQFINNTVS